jgi:hypothetical protein
MPIPGAAIRLGRCATGLAATLQATTCLAQKGDAYSNPFAGWLIPEPRPGFARPPLAYRSARRFAPVTCGSPRFSRPRKFAEGKTTP